jgi:hypothetical protein
MLWNVAASETPKLSDLGGRRQHQTTVTAPTTCGLKESYSPPQANRAKVVTIDRYRPDQMSSTQLSPSPESRNRGARSIVLASASSALTGGIGTPSRSAW